VCVASNEKRESHRGKKTKFTPTHPGKVTVWKKSAIQKGDKSLGKNIYSGKGGSSKQHHSSRCEDNCDGVGGGGPKPS